MQNFRSYTARQIVELLQQRRAGMLLDQLRSHKAGYKTESTYQLWQVGSHPQQMRTDETLWQKIEYLHYIPVKRGYVDDPLHWRYSSARNYAGQPGLIEVCTDWR